MTTLYEMVQSMRKMSIHTRKAHLDALVERAFRGDQRLLPARLDFNARLFTALREEKLWPTS